MRCKVIAQLPVPLAGHHGTGPREPGGRERIVCMTVLALKVSRAANGVSELHGEVSRQMWQCLYPNTPVEKVPIGSHHQRHPSARLDEGHRATVSGGKN
jgi:glucan phosphorylase